MTFVVPVRRPVKAPPSPYFAYRRPEDRGVLEPIGPHQVARQQTAAGLRCLMLFGVKRRRRNVGAN
jgi:hypothetical protein